MSLFTSVKEKKLWIWTFFVTVTIFSTLFLGQPLAHFFRNQDHRAIVFLVVMLLVGCAIFIHSFKTKPNTIELSVILGVTSVYIMFVLRLGMPERSHLMEYSILTILIHKALIERSHHKKIIAHHAFLSFIYTFFIAAIDETLQLFIPDRVFDPLDIIFNGNAIALALGSHTLMQWVRERSNKNNIEKDN